MAESKRCIGSTRYGIEPHEAPPENFPKQPSQKDGLGRMCKPHWNQYTAGLARDRKARTAGDVNLTPAETGRVAPRHPAKRGSTGALVHDGSKVKAARALVAKTDKLGGKAYTDAIASDEVQEALAVSAAASLGREALSAE